MEVGNLDRMDSLETLDNLQPAGNLDPAVLRQQADQQGYLWLPGLIDPRCIRVLRSRVLACIREGTTGAIQLQCAILPSPEFDAVRRHRPLIETLQGLFGGAVEAERGDVLRVVQPGAEPTPPHQDAYYAKSDATLWSAWIPLGDCPLELGPLAVWPGSHRQGLLPHGDSGITPTALAGARWAASAMPCGDALLLQHQTAHRALPNRSDQPRLSIDCRYGGA